MTPERITRAALLFGGCVTAAIGLGHTVLPTAGYPPEVALSMAEPVRDHFYYLGTYAICAFLLTFAVLSLYFAARPRNPAVPVVCAAFAVFWIARFVLELIFPVDLPIFFLERPHMVLTIVTGCVAAAYAVGALAAARTPPATT